MTTKTRVVTPMGNRILVKRAKAPASRGGILLPESSQEKPKQGEVLAVGPGKVDDKGHLHTMEVAKGQIVLFSSYAGTEVDVNDADNEYLILSEDDVLATLEAN